MREGLEREEQEWEEQKREEYEREEHDREELKKFQHSIVRSLKNLSNDLEEDFTDNLLHEEISHEEAVEATTQGLTTRLKPWQCNHLSKRYSDAFRKGICRAKAVFKADIDGSEILVWNNLTVTVYWAESNENNYKFIFRPPSSAKRETCSERRLSFF